MLRPQRCTLLTVLATLLLPALALAAGPRQVRVTLDERVTLQSVIETGLDVIAARPGVSADLYLWPGEDATLAALGAHTTVVDEDPGLHAAQRARADLAARGSLPARSVWSAARPDGRYRAETLPAPGAGSLGGFWTLAEVKMKLDDLVATDTQGVVADKLDTLGYSVQGRPIWGLKLCTSAGGPDTRPVAFFNALTHAREPGGMQALFYFADDLLARYGTDPVAKYLLENRQIYIVPVVNPDGYAYNQHIYDSTAAFGLWRKNLRDNNANGHVDSGDGVDINRNYGFKWGYDNVGSSGTASSDVYRGPSAFSEAETKVQRDAFSALKPVCGLSFHTYSDLFVHPWGYVSTATPDSAKFFAWDDEMSLGTGFLAGQGPRILYAVNGEFSDWTYGDTLSKPKAYTWTPEVGGQDDGFWPPPSRMTAISQTVLRACWTVAGIAGPWVRVERSTLVEGSLPAGGAAHLAVRVHNLGATGQAGPGLTATLSALDPGAVALGEPVGYPVLGSLQGADADGGTAFIVAADDSVTPGRMVRFQVDVTDGAALHCRDTVEVVVGVPTVKLLDPCQSLGNWTVVAGTWAVRTNDANHADAYLADSPAGTYTNNFAGQLKLTGTLDLSHGVHAWAFFENRYTFEQEYDGGQFEASLDGTNWNALPGQGAVTSDASYVGGAGHPIWTGSRLLWRGDRVDLSGFTGPTATAVRIRWRSLADAGTNFDGMNFDSLRVYLYDPALQPAPAPVAVGPGTVPARLALAPPAPNPARGHVAFAFQTPEAGPLALEILDVQGRAVWARGVDVGRDGTGGPAVARFTWGWDLRDRDGRAVPPGLYLARLRSTHHASVQRLVVLP